MFFVVAALVASAPTALETTTSTRPTAAQGRGELAPIATATAWVPLDAAPLSPDELALIDELATPIEKADARPVIAPIPWAYRSTANAVWQPSLGAHPRLAHWSPRFGFDRVSVVTGAHRVQASARAPWLQFHPALLDGYLLRDAAPHRLPLDRGPWVALTRPPRYDAPHRLGAALRSGDRSAEVFATLPVSSGPVSAVFGAALQNLRALDIDDGLRSSRQWTASYLAAVQAVRPDGLSFRLEGFAVRAGDSPADSNPRHHLAISSRAQVPIGSHRLHLGYGVDGAIAAPNVQHSAFAQFVAALGADAELGPTAEVSVHPDTVITGGGLFFALTPRPVDFAGTVTLQHESGRVDDRFFVGGRAQLRVASGAAIDWLLQAERLRPPDHHDTTIVAAGPRVRASTTEVQLLALYESLGARRPSPSWGDGAPASAPADAGALAARRAGAELSVHLGGTDAAMRIAGGVLRDWDGHSSLRAELLPRLDFGPTKLEGQLLVFQSPDGTPYRTRVGLRIQRALGSGFALQCLVENAAGVGGTYPGIGIPSTGAELQLAIVHTAEK